MKLSTCFLSTFCSAAVFDKQPEGDWEVQIGENQHLWTEELIEENWEIEFDILNYEDGESSTYTGLLFLSETNNAWDRVFSVFQKGFTNVLHFSWNFESSSKNLVCEFPMNLGEWNAIKVTNTPIGQYTIAGVTESQIEISLNGVVQPDCSKKQTYHAKYGDVAVMAAHWNWQAPSNAHLKNLKIKSWDATPPGEPIFQGKMVKTLQNVKESWRLSFDLLKTQEPTEYYSNFLTFSSKCMEEQNRAASLWQGGSTTYFSVNCNDTDQSISTNACSDIAGVGRDIPLMTWQNVVFEQTKIQNTDAYRLLISYNGEQIVDRVNTAFAPFTNGGISVSKQWATAASGFIDNIDFQTWALENECAMGTAKCDANAICTDLEKFYECTCADGFVGDGFTCEAATSTATSTTTTTTSAPSTTTSTPTTTTTTDPCECNRVVPNMLTEKALWKWKMMKPYFTTNTASSFTVSTSRAAGLNDYQGYLIFSRKTCKQLVLDMFRGANPQHAFSFEIIDKRAPKTNHAMPNYKAFNATYYQDYPKEQKDHRSITMGFNVHKTQPDITGNLKKDAYVLQLNYPNGLPNTVTWNDLYNCVNYARPVTIPMGQNEIAQFGVDPTCDYTACVGKNIMVGF
ncbi:Oidioi.mRNA.OKI2018_I69.PAR.g10010.t2.cds [Oikopleura dioica]|uniref:Oidioi.mRNA.OKI2018_I69.PAR.g10010.t2.cds n=1 Tax=Oikopleura dioica TaxID=34765 RepID=A0ABN7RNG0_OIKDI|nr:Oidioi.mRNA.OKI2018_I69.PAR.g10010.t2.cds [Oikopleura dioica]